MSAKTQIIFSDFDGTLTDGDLLGPVFFDVLNECNRLGLPLVIVSGRALSWGHFLLTHLPLSFAIMEGGGVVIEKKNKDFEQHFLTSAQDLLCLREVANELVEGFGVALTSDSLGRQTDRAIERSLLDQNLELKNKVEKFLDARGIHWSYSSVHLNFWCGDISKANGAQFLLKKFYPNINAKNVLFFGDAPNDQSMFKWASQSVGVSNITPYLSQLSDRPKIVLHGQENRGPYGVLNYLRNLSA